MSASTAIAMLRIESVRAARRPRPGVALACAIAVPVAAAIAIGLSLEPGTHDPSDEVLGLGFDRFVVTSALGFVLLQIGLVAAAGSLVSAARRRREFAIYSTCGAPRPSLVLAATWIASCFGAAGAAVGIGAGVSIAWILSRFDLAPGVTFASLAASAPFCGACFAIAVATCGAVGAVPARIASRVPPAEALLRSSPSVAESRGFESASIARVLLAVSLSVVAALVESPRAVGVGAALLAAVAWIATLPALLASSAILGTRLSLPFRIAARDASRLRQRFAPGVAAAAVSLSTAIALATLFSAVEARADVGAGAVEADRATLVTILALCAIAATATTLFSTSLAAIESESDARTLTFLGADPSLIRRCAAASAGVLATIASLCAVPAGAFVAMAWLAAADSPLTLRMPWPSILALAVAVPILAYASKRFGSIPRPPPVR